MGLERGILLLFLVSVSSRSLVDVPQANISSIQKFRNFLVLNDEEKIDFQGLGFKEEIQKLMNQYPDVVKTLSEDRDMNEKHLNELPPSWIFLLPKEPLVASWIKNPQNVLSKYLASLPGTDPIAVKISSAFSEDDKIRNDFLEELPQRKELSNSVWSLISEEVSEVWWSNKNASTIISDLVKLSKGAIQFLPFGIVDEAKEVDGLEIFSDDEDWSGVPRAHICIWKNVIEKKTLILRKIYAAFRHTLNPNESKGFIPLLRCFSPRDLTNWKSESNRVSNDKTPILKMIKSANKLGLNQLQVQALTDCIDWSDSSLDARQHVFHMLDASLIGPEDIKDYDEDYFRRFKISWDLIIRVKTLNKSDTVNESLSNDLLIEMGPIYVTRPRDEFVPEIGEISLEAANKVSSPWMRLSQGRNILKHMDNGVAIDSDLVFALPSTSILEWVDAKINRLQYVQKMTPSQKWAVAFNLLSNNEFVPYYYDILEWIHPKSNLTFLKGVQGLPDDLTRMILDNEWKNLSVPLSKKDINEKLMVAIPGLTCAKIASSSLLDLPIIVSAYQNYVKSKRFHYLSKYSPSLRLCMKDRMMKYLKQKALFYGLPNSLNALTVDEVKSFGGYILSSLKLEEIKKIDDPLVRKAIIMELGSLSIPELMPMISYSTLGELASMGVENQKPSFTAINQLGVLTYFLDEAFLMDLHPFDIRLFIKTTLSGDSTKKLTCMTKEDRQKLSKFLAHAFAAPRSWTPWNLIHLGDLLINLDPKNLTSIYPDNFRKAITQILEHSQLHESYASFEKFDRPTPFVNACESWLEEDDKDDNGAFRTAFNDLMRVYLKVAEYSIIVAKRNTVAVLPPKDLRSRRALKEKLFEVYSRMKHLWSPNGVSESRNWDYIRNLVIDVTTEKERLIKGIIQGENKDIMNATELYKVFRSSDTKISEHLDSIEDFLIDTQRLIIREFKFMNDLNAAQITPEYDEETFCAIVGCVDPDWCSLQTCLVTEYEDKPINLTCDGLIAAGSSGSSLNPNDLDHWTKENILDCLSVLGTISWGSKEKKLSVWNKIKDAVDLANTEQLLSLGTLLEVVELDNIEFKDKNIDAISLIGAYPRNLDDVMVSGKIQKYLEDAENSKEILELRKIGLGHLLCSLNLDGSDNDVVAMLFGPLYGQDQSPVPNGKNESRLFDFNRLTILKQMHSCDNEHFRKEVAKQVLEYYGGSLENMSSADVSAFGLFISGVEPTTLNKLPKENFEFISPSGVKYFSPDQVSQISVEKLSWMTPEALTQFKASHIPESFPMNSDQINLLRRNGIELLESEYELESDLSSEPATGNVVAPNSSSFNIFYPERHFYWMLVAIHVSFLYFI